MQKFVYAAALIMALGGAAQAAETCEADVKALQPAIDAMTDAAKKDEASKIAAKAIEEATVEMDENECVEMLGDLKKLLGMN